MTSPEKFRPRTIVIAEIGVNHNGDLGLAKDLVRAARDAGADYAKFQTFSSAELATAEAPLALYQEASTAAGSQRGLLAGLELPLGDFVELRDFCLAEGIGFLTTAHDFGSLEFVLELGLDFIKVPSGDLTNLLLFERIGREDTPVILSTGMGYLNEVQSAIVELERAGLDRDKVTVLQCTTNYPAPLEEANLRAMVAMGESLSVKIGYSDHTEGAIASVAAVALGATIIEKHLTLDQSMAGPDHSASANPEQFTELVTLIRGVEAALGDSEKEPSRSELVNRDVVRKSIVALRQIAQGEVFSEANIGVKRPGTGISPMRWHEVLGRSAHRDFSADELIELP